MQNASMLAVLRTVVYILAGIVLALGLVVGLSLLSSSAAVQNILAPFTFAGGEVVSNLIAPYLRSLLSGLGVVTLAISIVLSLLLYGLGRLLGYNLSLEARLRRLEQGALTAAPSQPA